MKHNILNKNPYDNFKDKEKTFRKQQARHLPSLSGGFSTWKKSENKVTEIKVNEGLKKIFLNSITYNYDRGNYVETIKDLKKYFLLNHYGEIINYTPGKEGEEYKDYTFNLLLFDLFYAILNWKHNNFSVFYSTLTSTLVRIDEIFEMQSKVTIDDLILNLVKNFLTAGLLQKINTGYDYIFSDDNLKFMMTADKHSLKIAIILIMVFFTFYQKSNFLAQSDMKDNKQQSKAKLNKEEVYCSLNKMLTENVCNSKNCPICTNEVISNLIFKTSSYSFTRASVSDNTIITIKPANSINNEKVLFKSTKKSIKDYLSPMTSEIKIGLVMNGKKTNSDFQKYMENATGFKGSLIEDSNEEGGLKQSTNTRSKSALSVPPLSNKNENVKKIKYCPDKVANVENKTKVSQNKNKFKSITATSRVKAKNNSMITTSRKDQNDNSATNRNEKYKNIRSKKIGESQNKPPIFTKTPNIKTNKGLNTLNTPPNTYSPSDKINNLVENLNSQIFAMDDILKKYGDQLKHIRDQLHSFNYKP